MRYYFSYSGKLLFLIYCFFISTTLFSQNKIDPGPIKADSNFLHKLCFGEMHKDEFGLEPICQSKNEIEIRLFSRFHLSNTHTLIVFSENNGKWNAEKFSKKSQGIWDVVSHSTLQSSEDSLRNSTLNMVFDLLKDHGLFILPDQSELKLPEKRVEGSIYIITFKVGAEFRSYRCNSIEDYAKENPLNEDLQNYNYLVRNLNSFF